MKTLLPLITWSEEGEDKRGRFRHSVCRAPGGIFSDENHSCVADILGADEQEALHRATAIVLAVNSHSILVDALRKIIKEAGVDDMQIAKQALFDAGITLTPEAIPPPHVEMLWKDSTAPKEGDKQSA